MAKPANELRENPSPLRLCTAGEKTDRLLDLMVGWWNGESLADLAGRHGIGRSRVRAILLRAGCVEKLRRPERRGIPDSARRAPSGRIERAKAMLAHRRMGRLTRRQLGAVAWAALGLALVDIGRRMGITPQGVQRLLVVAQDRLERKARGSRTEQAALNDDTVAAGVGPLTWDGLEGIHLNDNQHRNGADVPPPPVDME